MLRHPCILGDPQRQAREATSEVVPNKGVKKLKWLPQTLPSLGRKRYVTPAFLGSPTPSAGSKIKSDYLIPAFSGAQKRAEMLRHPCILRDPQCLERGAKSDLVPNNGEGNQKWLPHPCLLAGPKQGQNAMSPLHSRGSPTPSAGSNIRSGPEHRGKKIEAVA